MIPLFLAALAAAMPPRPVAHPRPPRVVTVTTSDYHFSLPRVLPAGPTTFVLVNRGRELHHLDLVRLADGKTVDDLVRALHTPGPLPSWATPVGGPNGTDPGARSLPTTLTLEPGRYAALCMIPSPDGVPHAMKGMVTGLTVKGHRHATARLPHADAEIGLVDYAFSTSRPLTRGVHDIVVRNDGTQDHELELVRLHKGKTVGDLAAWAQHMTGPPPAAFLGGVAPLARGASNEMRVDLAPGDYAFLCFIPDARDGKPHIAHGMMRQFTVQ